MKLKLKDGSLYVRKVVAGELVECAEGKPLVAIVSTEAVDSYGDIIHQGPTDKGRGWILERFNQKPRIYWMHDPFRPNLGKGRAWVEQNKLFVEIQFDGRDSFAADLDRKYRESFLSEWSVGFRAVVREPRGEGFTGEHFWEQILVENSAVNRGANPDTDTISKAAGLDPEEIDDQESSELALLKAELCDYREEFEQRLRAIETSVMRGAREADQDKAQQAREGVLAIVGRMNATLDQIVAKQS